MIRKLQFVLAALLLSSHFVAQAPGLHDFRRRLPVSQGWCADALMVDVNADSRPDLVRATEDSFGVFLQDAGGRFEALDFAKTAVPKTVVVALAAGRITQSTLPDLIVGYRNGTVLIYPNNPTSPGKFGRPWRLPAFSGSTNPAVCDVLVGDLDGDAKQRDEIVVTLNQERAIAFYVAGTNLFKQVRNASGPILRLPVSALADLDGDKDLDFISVTSVGTAPAMPAVYSNSGGFLKADITAFPTTVRLAAPSLVVANVTGTRFNEVIAGPTATTAARGVRVFANTSTTVGVIKYAIRAVAQQFLVTHPTQLLARDLNRDGRPDLVATNRNGSVVAGLNSPTTPGSFLRARAVLAAAPRGPLCVEDFDGDKDIDLLATGRGIEDILLLGKATATTYKWVDTESQGMPIGKRSHYLMGISDVNADGDPDLIAWDAFGRPSMMTNLRGQARFRLATNTKVPTLPLGSYLDAQPAKVANVRGGDFLVLRATSGTSTPGVRVVMRATTGQLLDVTTQRWRVTTTLRSMTVADVSPGSPGLSDIVGVDYSGYLQLVRNRGGFFTSTVQVSTVKASLASKILVADLNLDKRQDLIVIQPGNYVRVLLHHATINDRFVAIGAPAMKALTGVVEDFTGDLRPDLVLAPSVATGTVQLWSGVGNGKFLNATATYLPRNVPVGIVTDMAVLRSMHTTDKSIVLGMQRGADRILRASRRKFGAPAVLPYRGSTQTRRLFVADLDKDGDDDLVTSRWDSAPSLLLGQSYQFDHVGGIAQAGRQAMLRVALPNATHLGAVAIGWPTVRVPLPGLGVLRMGRISVMLPAFGPSTKLVHTLGLPVPANVALVTFPMQLITVDTGTRQLYFRNLDEFSATDH